MPHLCPLSKHSSYVSTQQAIKMHSKMPEIGLNPSWMSANNWLDFAMVPLWRKILNYFEHWAYTTFMKVNTVSCIGPINSQRLPEK